VINPPLSVQNSANLLLRLAIDLPKIWFSPTTTWTERKDFVRIIDSGCDTDPA